MASTYTPKSTYPLWLGGQEVRGRGESIPIHDPATGSLIAQCDAASEEDVADAIAVGQKAFDKGEWSRMAPADRAAIMSSIARLFSSRVPSLAVLESLQTGRPLREMSTQLGRLSEWFEYFGALARTEEGSTQPVRGSLLNYVRGQPLGVCALVSSFNHPLLISVKKLAPALAAGNSVILKPSELAPLTVLELGRITKEAGLPDGVLSILPGYGPITGKALVSDPRIKKVDVTGGTAGGRVISSIAGGNLASVTAELGGKAPIIVFAENTDLEIAVNGVAFASFIASGQTCVAGTRIIVSRSILPSFLSLLAAKCASITRRIGHPNDQRSMMGPVISERQLKVVETLVEDARQKGAEIVCGGERMTGVSELDGKIELGKGYFYPPTLITSSSNTSILDCRIWKEEAFGPVLAIVPFDTEEEAIGLANDSEYGLGSAIWTRDGSQAIRVSNALDVGLVWVNTHHRNDPSSAWGGTKNSGIGSENGKHAYQSYQTTKSVIINYAPEELAHMDDWFREGDADVRYG
ncbi:betaine aldehyde dehydrogenase [Leucosporidium creatinivorum]|uniref:Betaine aldehyde dehydrogenase n=1 Tax=Leucosporidium creatinivorum TaxID=106004 RepID=A0A1Y2FCW8_9BASI|nr:betaine aldehyde dehydrogenase [Leucosporidium creatinivorum]